MEPLTAAEKDVLDQLVSLSRNGDGWIKQMQLLAPLSGEGTSVIPILRDLEARGLVHSEFDDERPDYTFLTVWHLGQRPDQPRLVQAKVEFAPRLRPSMLAEHLVCAAL